MIVISLSGKLWSTRVLWWMTSGKMCLIVDTIFATKKYSSSLDSAKVSIAAKPNNCLPLFSKSTRQHSERFFKIYCHILQQQITFHIHSSGQNCRSHINGFAQIDSNFHWLIFINLIINFQSCGFLKRKKYILRTYIFIRFW